MVQLGNGRSQAKPEQPKPRLRFTGQRLTLLRPEAEPHQQVPYHHICRKLRVSEHTLKAIEKAESLSIAEKNRDCWKRLCALLVKLRIASKIKSTANITRATVAFGVATEKIMLLSARQEADYQCR